MAAPAPLPGFGQNVAALAKAAAPRFTSHTALMDTLLTGFAQGVDLAFDKEGEGSETMTMVQWTALLAKSDADIIETLKGLDIIIDPRWGLK